VGRNRSRRRRQPRSASVPLVTRDALRRYRRASPEEIASRYRVTLIALGAILTAGSAGAAMAYSGASVGMCIVGALATGAVVVMIMLVASWITGREVVPDLLPHDVDLREHPTTEGHKAYGTRAKAQAEADRRNETLAPDAPWYWIEVERSTGIWTVERRPLKRTRTQPIDLGPI